MVQKRIWVSGFTRHCLRESETADGQNDKGGQGFKTIGAITAVTFGTVVGQNKNGQSVG